MNNATANFPLESIVLATPSIQALKSKFQQILQEVSGERIQINKSLATTLDWHAVNCEGATAVSFFQGTPLANATNLPNSLVKPQDEHSLILGIRAWSDDDDADTISDIAWQNGIVDAEMLNGSFSVYSNGIKYLDGIPMTVFLQTAEQGESGLYPLAVPIPWIGQTDFEIRVNSPSAIGTTGLAKAWVMFGLVGIGTVS